MIKPASKRSFSLGRLVATPAALELLDQHGKTPHEFIQRHLSGDWGDVCPEDAALNDASIEDGSRILSSYKLGDQKLWVISEAADDYGHRSATTILLSSEY